MVNTIRMVVVIVAVSNRGLLADEHGGNTYHCHFAEVKALKPGQVYRLSGSQPQFVCDLLTHVDLKTDRAWVDHASCTDPYRNVIVSTQYCVCGDRSMAPRQTEIALCADTASLASVKGDQELPAIVNRPLTGL